MPSHKLKLKDFELFDLIGKGGFGQVRSQETRTTYTKVYVAKKKDTGELVALKVMQKSLIWKKNKVRQIKNERDVLAASKQSRFIVDLLYSFQDAHHLYLAMVSYLSMCTHIDSQEYCPGGDMRHYLQAVGAMEEEDSRIYIAEMILATYQLHQMGFVHRDLKPDNFLIDSFGHLKLADFGFVYPPLLPLTTQPLQRRNIFSSRNPKGKPFEAYITHFWGSDKTKLAWLYRLYSCWIPRLHEP